MIPVRKYYFNFTAWTQLPKPESETSPIAIATSDIRKEVVAKEWAYVVDVALNPIVFPSNDISNETAKCVLIELSFRYVETKFSLKLSRKHKILDEEKYIGNTDNLLNFMCPTALKSTLSDAVKGVNNNLNFDQIRRISRNDLNGNEKNHNSSTADKPTKSRDNYVTSIKSSNSSYKNELKEVKTVSYNDTVKTNNQQKPTKLPRPKVEMVINKETRRIEITIFLPQVENVQECDLDLSEVSH